MTKIINYKGKEIIYIDHSNLKSKELDVSMLDANKFVLSQLQNELLVLVNVNNTSLDKSGMEILKSENEKKAIEKTKKAAVIGIDGIRKVLYNFYQKFIGGKTQAFGTEEEAKEFLVK